MNFLTRMQPFYQQKSLCSLVRHPPGTVYLSAGVSWPLTAYNLCIIINEVITQIMITQQTLLSQCSQLLSLSESDFTANTRTFGQVNYRLQPLSPLFQLRDKLYKQLSNQVNSACVILLASYDIQLSGQPFKLLLFQKVQLARKINLPQKLATDLSSTLVILDLLKLQIADLSNKVYKSQIRRCYLINLFQCEEGEGDMLTHFLGLLEAQTQRTQDQDFIKIDNSHIYKFQLAKLVGSGKKGLFDFAFFVKKDLLQVVGRIDTSLTLEKKQNKKPPAMFKEIDPFRRRGCYISILTQQNDCLRLKWSGETPNENQFLIAASVHDLQLLLCFLRVQIVREGLDSLKVKRNLNSFECQLSAPSLSLCLEFNQQTLTEQMICQFVGLLQGQSNSKLQLACGLISLSVLQKLRSLSLKKLQLREASNINLVMLENLLKEKNVVELTFVGCNLTSQFVGQLSSKGILKACRFFQLHANLPFSLVTLVHHPALTTLKYTSPQQRHSIISSVTISDSVNKQMMLRQNLLVLPKNILIVHVDCMIDLQSFNSLSSLRLQQLKIRIFDQNKRIFKQDTKKFAEAMGPTLKRLDLSESSVKFKYLKQVFCMPNLKELLLNKCTKIGQDSQIISKSVEVLEVNQIRLPFRQMRNLLGYENVQFFSRLSLCSKSSSQEQTLTMVSSFKFKLIKELEIELNQFTPELSQFDSKQLQIKKLSIRISQVQEEDFRSAFFLYFFNNKPVNFILNEQLVKPLQEVINKIAVQLSVNSFRFSINSQWVKSTSKRVLNYRSLMNSNHQLDLSHSSINDSSLNFILRQLKACHRQIISISIKGCRNLTKNSISIIFQYYPETVDINFKDCVFRVSQVHQILTNFTFLTQLNQGQLHLQWTRQVIKESQLNLSLLLRLKNIIQLSLDIDCQEQSSLVFQLLLIIIQSALALDKVHLTLEKADFQKQADHRDIWLGLSNSSIHKIQLQLIECRNISSSCLNSIMNGVMFTQSLKLKIYNCQIQQPCDLDFRSSIIKSLDLSLVRCWWVNQTFLSQITGLFKTCCINQFVINLDLCHQIGQIALSKIFSVLTKARKIGLTFQGNKFSKNLCESLISSLNNNSVLQAFQLSIQNCKLGSQVKQQLMRQLLNKRLLSLRVLMGQGDSEWLRGKLQDKMLSEYWIRM